MMVTNTAEAAKRTKGKANMEYYSRTPGSENSPSGTPGRLTPPPLKRRRRVPDDAHLGVELDGS